MIVKNCELTLLKTVLKEGVGKKSQQPYKFYVASVVDEDANVFNMNLADEIVDSSDFEVISVAKNVSVRADIKFSPKGFDIGGTIVAVKPFAVK